MKKKILIIFKYPRGNWNGPVIRKFSNFYDVEHLYISNYSNLQFFASFLQLIFAINANHYYGNYNYKCFI